MSRATHPKLAAGAFGLFAAAGCTQILGYGDPVERRPTRSTPTGDAGPDASVTTDAGDSSTTGEGAFCASLSPKPVFCASFDGTDYVREWASVYVQNGRYERETVEVISPPASLVVRSDRIGLPPLVMVVRDFPAWASRPLTATISMRVRIDAADPDGSLAVIAEPHSVLDPAQEPIFLTQLAARQSPDGGILLDLTEVEMPANGVGHRLEGEFAMGTWLDVRVVLALPSTTATGNTATVLVDGVSRFEGPLERAPRSGTPRVGAGVAFAESSTAPWVIRYDNVVVDYR